MEIKDILKHRRIELELTQLDVATAVGVSEATVSRWESGDIANMRRSRIAALARVLQISPSVIMGWNEDTTTQSTNFSSLLYNDGVFPHLLKTYETLNTDGRQKVYERATELAELPKYQLTPATDDTPHPAHSSEAMIQKYREQGYPVSDGLHHESASTARVASPIILPTPEDTDDKK